MRPITKLFLLLVAAFVVYLVWPRTPDLKNFDPGKLAALEVENWKAQRDNKGWGGLTTRFKIYTSQYHFSPIGAFRMAQNQGAALEILKQAHADKQNDALEGKAVTALTEKYAMMKREAGEAVEPDALAREEIAWFTYLMDGAPVAQVADPLSRIFAARYGGLPGDFVDASNQIAQAQVLIFSNQEQDPQSGMSAIEHAREGYKLLKEVAATPVVQPEATPQ